MPNKHLHEANRLSWNAVVVAHSSHKKDHAGLAMGRHQEYAHANGCKLLDDMSEALE